MNTLSADGGHTAPMIRQPAYGGHGGVYCLLYMKLCLLMVLTFGTYCFWGKNGPRDYMVSRIEIDGDPFVYQEYGREKLIGALRFIFIIALFVFLLTLLVCSIAQTFLLSSFVSDLLFGDQGYAALKIGACFMAALFFFLILSAARFRALRYGLSHTGWRGVQFELRARTTDYMILKIRIFLFNVVSLGLYRPFGDVALLRFTLNKIYYGDRVFVYRGTVAELQRTYYLCWLLFLPTLGCSLFWYRSKYIAHVAKHTALGAMQFRLKIEGGEYIRYAIGNVLLMVFTLGLAYPVVMHRRVLFYLKHARLRGALV